MEIREIVMSEIIALPDFMIRDGIDKTLVAKYKDNLEEILLSSPIEIYETPDGLYLVDGFHRRAAARQLEQTTIRAAVHRGSVADAYAAACLANLRHGKPLARAERKRAIGGYIKLKVKQSDRLIAKEVGVSRMTIKRYRAELEASGEIEPQEKRTRSDGHTTSMSVTNVTDEDIAKPEPEPEPEPDLYDSWIAEHVICGDALEILPTLERKFDLIIVDPPYGITTEEWDLTNKHDLLAFTRRWLSKALRLLKSTGRLYIFWSREYMLELKPLLDEIAGSYPLEFGGMIVWNFRNVLSQPDNRRRYKLSWEPVFHYYGLEAPVLNFPETEITGKDWKGKGDVQSDVWVFSIPQSNYEEDKRIHPTQKPWKLYKRIIETSTHVNDSVLDFFAGAGTTGHAALLTGREFLLIEQDATYVKEITKRLRPIWEKGLEEGRSLDE